MSARGTQLLWGMLAVGTAVRLFLAFNWYGVDYDIDSFRLVADTLHGAPLEVYGDVNDDELLRRWPYPPVYFGWIFATDWLEDWTGLEFHALVQLPPIFADAAIAWLVQDFLGRRGASERTRLAAAALVALSASFAAVSGFHGQIDSFAILPAVVALWLWERDDRRPLAVGALIGLAAAIKTTPILLLLAFLPAARSRREAGLLLAGALAVPLALTAPFLVADFDGVRHSLNYRGVMGAGGLSLLVQPNLAESWLSTFEFDFNPASEWLRDHGSVITLAALAALAAFLARRRLPATEAAALVWLTVYVFGVNFAFQYVPWGVPFFLMAGYVRETAWLQALLLVPTVVLYTGPRADTDLVLAYTPFMLVVWVAMGVALFLKLRALARVPAGAA